MHTNSWQSIQIQVDACNTQPLGCNAHISRSVNLHTYTWNRTELVSELLLKPGSEGKITFKEPVRLVFLYGSCSEGMALCKYLQVLQVKCWIFCQFCQGVIFKYKHIFIYIYIYIYIYIRIFAHHAYTHTYIHMHTYIHVDTNKRTHTGLFKTLSCTRGIDCISAHTYAHMQYKRMSLNLFMSGESQMFPGLAVGASMPIYACICLHAHACASTPIYATVPSTHKEMAKHVHGVLPLQTVLLSPDT